MKENEEGLTSSRMLETAISSGDLTDENIINTVQETHRITLLNPNSFLTQVRKALDEQKNQPST